MNVRPTLSCIATTLKKYIILLWRTDFPIGWTLSRGGLSQKLASVPQPPLVTRLWEDIVERIMKSPNLKRGQKYLKCRKYCVFYVYKVLDFETAVVSIL